MAVESKSLCSNNSLSDFNVFYDSRLGKGGFAEVFRANRKVPYQEVAIKMISKTILREKSMEKRIWDEVRIHQSLKHPRIVRMFECFQDDKYIYIVMELCTKGDLRKYIESNKRLSEAKAADLLEQIIDGVLYLHNNMVIHRDLSVSNIFLDEDENVKIGDFGLSTRVIANEKHNTMCGTPNFMAPEVALKQPYGFEADVWSIGCLLYNMLTGHAPYGRSRQFSETLKQIVSSDVSIPDSLSREAASLIRKLIRGANYRLKLRDVRNEPFMQKYKKRSLPHSYASSADSGRGTITTNGSAFSSADNVHRSRSLERKSSRHGLPSATAPIRVFRADSTPRLPPPIVPVVYSVESKHSEPRYSSRSCERSTNGGAEHYCCNHSRLNDENVCVNCHRMLSQQQAVVVPAKNSCHHNSRSATEFRCPPSNYESENGRPPSAGSREKCRSYREDGVCGGKCKTKFNAYVPPLQTCTEEPSCSKDSYTHRRASPRMQMENAGAVRDQRGRSLRDIIAPLNTVRLKPTVEESDKYTFGLLDNGHVCVEIKLNTNGVSFVSEKIGVSNDGLTIAIEHPKPRKGESWSRGGRQLSIDWFSSDKFTFDNLPTKYWKLYQLAGRFVNLLRGKTWKIKYATSCGNYYLMENGNFEARFKNGKIAAKKKLSNNEWASITCDDGVELNAEEISLVDSILVIVCQIELALDSLESPCYPIVSHPENFPGPSANISSGKENSRLCTAPSPIARHSPRKPLSEATNRAKAVSQRSKRLYLRKYKCHVTQFYVDGDLTHEFAYEDGDKLWLLKGGKLIKYTSSGGANAIYNQGDSLPEFIQKKVEHFTDILELCKTKF